MGCMAGRAVPEAVLLAGGMPRYFWENVLFGAPTFTLFGRYRAESPPFYNESNLHADVEVSLSF